MFPMPDEDATASAAKEAASLIPEVYYDLISRFTAGLAVLLTWLYSGQNRKLLDALERVENHAGKAAVGLVILLGGYVVGILLSTLAYSAESALDWYFAKFRSQNKRQTLAEF